MRPAPTRALVALALAAVVLAAGPAQAQTRSQPALDALAAPLFAQLAALKGTASPGAPPPVVLRTREENRRYIAQEMDRRYSPARVEAERKGMVAWGLIPRDYDLRRLFLDLMEEQVSAYYDPQTKLMVLGDWLTPAQQQAALLHELVHALQDREISLDTFISPDPGRGDQLLARQALIEGEAVGLSFDVVLKAQGADFAGLPDVSALRGMIAAGTVGPVISSAPTFLRDLLLFPYVEGVHFVHQFRKRQPWSAMPGLYRDPPRSTTQILRPETRFDSRQDPIPIALPDLGPFLPGATAVIEDELGEFALGAVAGLVLGPAEGRRVVHGWRGDRYRLWEEADGRFVLAYVVAMQSAPMANFLALQLTRIVEERHPSLAGKGVPGKTGAIVTWQRDGRAFAVEKRGTEVLLLEQAPASAAERIREAVWRTRGMSQP